jgi:hypothetical protein
MEEVINEEQAVGIVNSKHRENYLLDARYF